MLHAQGSSLDNGIMADNNIIIMHMSDSHIPCQMHLLKFLMITKVPMTS